MGLALVGSPSQLNIATVATTYAVVAVSLVVLTGWAGTVSLGQIAILGTGGVVAGDLMARWNVDFFLAMVAAGAAGAVVALLVAVPALRVNGQLLAVTTLTFAVAVDTFFFNPTNFAWLVPGAFDRPVLFQRWDMRDDRVLYCVGLALVLLVGGRRAQPLPRADPPGDGRDAGQPAGGRGGVRRRRPDEARRVRDLRRPGRAWPGAVHATALGAVGLRTYNTQLSLLAFTTVVIGGVSSIGGAIAATVAVHTVVYFVPQLQLVATGAGVLARPARPARRDGAGRCGAARPLRPASRPATRRRLGPGRRGRCVGGGHPRPRCVRQRASYSEPIAGRTGWR